MIPTIRSRYDRRVLDLGRIYKERGQGAARDASGKIFEYLVDDVIEMLGNGYTVKDGETDKVLSVFEGHRRGVQVDRHVFLDGRRWAFVECKTYLDASYFQRFILNVTEIVHALGGPGQAEHLKFAVLAGQDAADHETIAYLQAMAVDYTGVEVEVFFVNAGKRSSEKPIYTERFPLLGDAVEDFISFIADLD